MKTKELVQFSTYYYWTIATVNKGTVKGVKAGTTTITVKSGSKTVTVSVTVKNKEPQHTGTTKDPNDVTITYKTYTLNPTSLQDAVSGFQKAQQNAIGILSSSSWFTDANGVEHYIGPIIVGMEVLSYKKVKCDIVLQGPTPDGKSPTGSVWLSLPNEVRFKIHRHKYETDATAKGLGAFLVGITNNKWIVTYSCSCGADYGIYWDIPVDEQIIGDATISQSTYVCSAPYSISAGR